MKKTLVVAVLLGIMIPQVSFSQEVPSDDAPTVLTLEEAVRIALSENVAVKVADKEIERSQYARKGSYAALFPQVDGSASYSRTIKKQVMYMDFDMSALGGGGMGGDTADPAEVATRAADAKAKGTTPGGGILPPGPGHRGMPQRAEAWGAEEWGANGGLNTRPLIGFDVTAEFNFFEYGNDWEVGRIKPYTPYIFLGVGCGVYNFDPSTWDHSKLGIPASVYVPFGIGFKWKFAPRWGMNIAWQHNLYFKDNLEGKKDLNNTHELNGSNILENDLTGQFTLGIVFDFLKPKKACTTCSFFN